MPKPPISSLYGPQYPRLPSGASLNNIEGYEETHERFFGQLRARLEVLSAQRSEERQAEEEINSFKRTLEGFIAPLQREFDTRRGGFRNFLRKTIPTQIEARVETASTKARKAIQGDLKKLRDVAHWKTLQAAVRQGGYLFWQPPY